MKTTPKNHRRPYCQFLKILNVDSRSLKHMTWTILHFGIFACLILDGIAWYWMVLDGIGWYWMVLVLGGIGWYWMVLDDIGWYWMILDGTGWYWMVLDGTCIGWYWLVLDGPGNPSKPSVCCRGCLARAFYSS